MMTDAAPTPHEIAHETGRCWCPNLGWDNAYHRDRDGRVILHNGEAIKRPEFWRAQVKAGLA